MHRLALVACVSLSGCVFTTPAVHLPAAAPNVRTSDVDVEVVRGDGPADPEVAEDVRSEVLWTLSRAEREGEGGEATPIKVRVTLATEGGIEDEMRVDGCAAVGLLAAPFGAALWWSKVTVDVSYAVKGVGVTGHGEANENGSLYSRARKRALARALEAAFVSVGSSGTVVRGLPLPSGEGQGEGSSHPEVKPALVCGAHLRNAGDEQPSPCPSPEGRGDASAMGVASCR